MSPLRRRHVSLVLKSGKQHFMFQVCLGYKLLQWPSLPGIARMNAGHVLGWAPLVSSALQKQHRPSLAFKVQHRNRHPCGKNSSRYLWFLLLFFFLSEAQRSPSKGISCLFYPSTGTWLCIIDAQLPDALLEGLGFLGVTRN